MISNILSRGFPLLLLLFYLANGSAQNATIEGIITSTEGDTLSFASVYSANSGQGSSSNEEGKYRLSLNVGNHQIIAQYVGYEKFQKTVRVQTGENRILNIQLRPIALELTEVVIKGKRNPADQIIREVINRRARFKDSSTIFEANVYIKGNYRLDDAPEKLMVFKVGGLDSIIGDWPSNIIYLSETKSVFTKLGDRQKEKVLASKTSGFGSLPSMNNASIIDVNFYENNPSLLGKTIKSPVANDAFQHYKYKLLGAYRDQEDRLINRIQVTPKQKMDPLVEGIIEIVEDQWVIKSLRFRSTGDRLKITVLDTVKIRQIFLPMADKEVWPMVQTDFVMDVSAFGFKAHGGFTGVFSNYIFNPDLFTNKIDRIRLEYVDSAFMKDSIFWLDERPIELTSDEELDYEYKDSLQKVNDDPERLDSIERENNKFQLQDILSGYELRKRKEQVNFSVSSPLTELFFNPVQGFNATSTVEFIKAWKNNDSLFRLSTEASAQYGFADQTWRYWGEIGILKNDFSPFELSIYAGQKLLQINNKNPISLFANQFSNLVFKYHFIRFYESRKVELQLKKQFDIGLRLKQNLLWERRSFVENNTNFSIFSKDIPYADNIPDYADIETNPSIYRENQIIKWRGELRYQAGIKYIKYPTNRIRIPSNWPIFELRYEWGIPVGPSQSDYFHLEGEIDYSMQMGIAGYSRWVLKGGGFLSKNELTFFDYKHFTGNEFFINDSDYKEDFLLLPYYKYSTDLPYMEFHWGHSFNSYILNKVPVVRKLGFSLVLKGSYLHHKDVGHYNELSLGVDKLGWGVLRLFRLDFIASFINGNYHEWGIVFGSTFTPENF